jgi:Tol biopolymer transport system component
MSKLWTFRLLSVGLLSMWIAACSHTSPIQVSKGELQNHIALVKETQLTQDGWNLIRWSPDSSSLLLMQSAYTQTTPENARLAIVNVENGSLREIPQSGISSIWSPDSQALMIKSVGENRADQFWLYSLKDNKSVLLNGVMGSPVLWLTDGRFIYEANDGLWSARLNLPKASYPSEQISITEHVALLSFDGTVAQRWSSPSPNLEAIILYDGTHDNDRKWWLVQPNGALINVGKPFYSIGTCCAWARDGHRFAFFSSEPELGLYLVDNNGENLRQVITAKDIGDGVFISMDFSPDSQTLAFEWSMKGEGFPFGNTQIYLINIDGSGLRNLTPNSAPHRWLHWSPDGKYIAYLGSEGEVRIAQVIIDNP